MNQVIYLFILKKFNSYVARCDILIRSKVLQRGVGPCEALRGGDGARKFAPPCRRRREWGKTKPFRTGVKTPSFGLIPPHCHP